MRRSESRAGALGTLRRLVPPSHRLFAVFEDRAAAEEALAGAVAAGVLDASGCWWFDGQEGARHLDPTEPVQGLTGAFLRVMVWVFSTNVEYLTILADALRAGRTAVAVAVRGQDAADRVARWLWFGGGEAFAYTTHLNYVPVQL
jgi:hypothetical protein